MKPLPLRVRQELVSHFLNQRVRKLIRIVMRGVSTQETCFRDPLDLVAQTVERMLERMNLNQVIKFELTSEHRRHFQRELIAQSTADQYASRQCRARCPATPRWPRGPGWLKPCSGRHAPQPDRDRARRPKAPRQRARGLQHGGARNQRARRGLPRLRGAGRSTRACRCSRAVRAESSSRPFWRQGGYTRQAGPPAAAR